MSTIRWHEDNTAAWVTVAIVIVAAWFSLAHRDTYFEPDPFAYRAQVAALADGHVTLSKSQYKSLESSLKNRNDDVPTTTGRTGGLPMGGPPQMQRKQPVQGQQSPQRQQPPQTDGNKPPGAMQDGRMGGAPSITIAQWVVTKNKRYVSEKNPGYSYLLVPFWKTGTVRLAPTLFAILGSFLLWIGIRRWLNGWAATTGVALLLMSPLMLVMSARPFMPTYVGAMLIAGAIGALLFSVFEAAGLTRTAMGCLAMLLLSVAVSIRYTDVALLLVAIAAVVAWALSKSGSKTTASIWCAAAIPVLVACAAYNQKVFGGVLKTGYSLQQADISMRKSNFPQRDNLKQSSGKRTDVTFSVDAIGDNLNGMPPRLIRAAPFAFIVPLAGLIAWMMAMSGKQMEPRRWNQPIVIAAAASWGACWLVYLAYDWTTHMPSMMGSAWAITTRFYAPAFGAIALLGACLAHRALRNKVGALIVGVVVALSVISGLWLGNNEMDGGGANRMGPRNAQIGGQRMPGMNGGSPGMQQGQPPQGQQQGRQGVETNDNSV